MKFETHMHSQTHTSILLSLLPPIANHDCSCTFVGKDMAYYLPLWYKGCGGLRLIKNK